MDTGEKIIPALRTALWKPDFEGFDVKVEGFEERPPDGWFHPSIHPLWTTPMLYIYLEEYHRMVRDPFDPSSTMAVTAGSFFHSFVQTVLVREGILERQPEECACGLRHPERAEVYLEDEETRSRGHSDGVVHTGEAWEFKTMNTFKLGRIPQGTPWDPDVIDWFKTANRQYYAQAQEYLRLSGRDEMVVLLLSLTYPFEMKEVHVPFDKVWAMRVRDKFMRAIQAAADHRMPRCECSPKEQSSCGARGVCTYG